MAIWVVLRWWLDCVRHDLCTLTHFSLEVRLLQQGQRSEMYLEKRMFSLQDVECALCWKPAARLNGCEPNGARHRPQF